MMRKRLVNRLWKAIANFNHITLIQYIHVDSEELYKLLSTLTVPSSTFRFFQSVLDIRGRKTWRREFISLYTILLKDSRKRDDEKISRRAPVI